MTFTWPEEAPGLRACDLVVRCGGGGGGCFGLMLEESGDHTLTKVRADRRGWLSTNGYGRVESYSFA